MQDASKLMLTIVAGGVLMGAALSRMATPTMQFAAQPEWRQHQHDFSATPWQFSASLPEDLSPLGWTAGAFASSQSSDFVQAAAEVTYPDEPIFDEAVYTASEDAAATAAMLDEPSTATPLRESAAAIREVPPTFDLPQPKLAADLDQ